MLIPVVEWIKDFYQAVPVGKAVLGISGGKDSYVVAALLVRALGAENVIGVLMPNGIQGDIEDSEFVVSSLGIKRRLVNIGQAYESIVAETCASKPQALQNIPPRLRMTVLYAIAAQEGALVAGTSNASERYVGYGTKHGDLACDFNPILALTKSQVIELGQEMSLSPRILLKPPSDGLSGLTDEDNLGVSYAEIDGYLRGETISAAAQQKIDALHASSSHKRNPTPFFIMNN